MRQWYSWSTPRKKRVRVCAVAMCYSYLRWRNVVVYLHFRLVVSLSGRIVIIIIVFVPPKQKAFCFAHVCFLLFFCFVLLLSFNFCGCIYTIMIFFLLHFHFHFNFIFVVLLLTIWCQWFYRYNHNLKYKIRNRNDHNTLYNKKEYTIPPIKWDAINPSVKVINMQTKFSIVFILYFVFCLA